MKKLLIVGASGHGKVLADIAQRIGYGHIAFLDDSEELKICGGYPVIGKSMDAKLYSEADFIIAIGNAQIREKMQKKLEQSSLKITTLVHPNAVIAKNVNIGAGSVVMAGVVINPGATIGSGCIINTCSSVDHDCKIESFVHIAVGSHLAGSVEVGSNTWVGAGSVISNNIKICHNCTIGAGAVVIKDIRIPGTYFGVPAERKIQ